MFGRGKARSYAWLVAVWAAWTVFGLFSAGLVVFRTSFSKRPYTWSSALHSELGYAYIAAALSAGVVWLAKRYRLLKRPYVRHFAVHVAGAIVYSSIAKVLWDLLRVGPTAPYLVSGFSVFKL